MTLLLLPSLLRNARRTLELSAELSVTRGCWRELIPQVHGVVFYDFRHSCHQRRIFNRLNNFVHKWTFPHSVRAFWAISSVIDANACACVRFLDIYTTQDGWCWRKSRFELVRRWRDFLVFSKYEKNACAFASITELIAQKAFHFCPMEYDNLICWKYVSKSK